MKKTIKSLLLAMIFIIAATSAWFVMGTAKASSKAEASIYQVESIDK